MILEQALTVDEHFKQLLEDDTSLDLNQRKVTYNDLPNWFDADLFKK